jgi:hypothetical protein
VVHFQVCAAATVEPHLKKSLPGSIKFPIPSQTDLPSSYNIAPQSEGRGNSLQPEKSAAFARRRAVGVDSILGCGAPRIVSVYQPPNASIRQPPHPRAPSAKPGCWRLAILSKCGPASDILGLFSIPNVVCSHVNVVPKPADVVGLNRLCSQFATTNPRVPRCKAHCPYLAYPDPATG